MTRTFREYFSKSMKLRPSKCKNCGAKVMPTQYKCPSCGAINRTEVTPTKHIPEEKARAAYKTSQYKPPEYS